MILYVPSSFAESVLYNTVKFLVSSNDGFVFKSPTCVTLILPVEPAPTSIESFSPPITSIFTSIFSSLSTSMLSTPKFICEIFESTRLITEFVIFNVTFELFAVLISNKTGVIS